MARVNHRRVKDLVAEKRKSITDRQFFTSRILAGHYSDIAMAQTRRYKFSRRVKVSLEWKPRSPEIAMTNNDVIWINTGNRMVTAKKSRKDRYDIITGLFAHELGHVFYTPFPMGQTHGNRFKEYKWFPERPKMKDKTDKANERAMWTYCKDNPEKQAAMLQLLHGLHNVIEDGYIENKMMDRFPGVFKHGLEVMRQVQYELTPSLSEMIEHEKDGEQHIWETIQALILSYVIWGEMKYGEEPLTDERVQVVFGLLFELDDALLSSDPKDRYRVVNTIVLRCWKYISDFLDHCEAVSMASGGSSSISGTVSTTLASISGTTAIPSGTTGAVPDVSGPARISASARRAETAMQAASAGHPPKEKPEEEDPPEAEEEEAEEEKGPDDGSADEEPDEAEGPNPVSNGKIEGQDGTAAQDVSAEEGGRIPFHQTTNLSEPMDGSVTRDEEYKGGGYTRSADDIHDILEAVAESAAYAELESERSITLNSLAQNISFGDIHAGCDFEVHRMIEVTDEQVEDYRDVAPELLHISGILKRSMLQQLQDRQKGGKQTGMMMGRKLEARALHRKDGRPFYKNNLPNDRPEMAVALLLDESGSMGCSHRATYARASAVIMHDFCLSLNIPVMIYGHSTSGTTVDLYSYAEFDTIGRDDCFRLMDISARESNRDGAALRFVAEQLAKRPEEFKLLILVSDGQPAASGYGGTAAEEDLRGIKQEYKRKGITFVAAAIGSDKDNIKRIYGDSFLDITDLKKLPVKLTEVVKRNIRM